MFYGKKHFKTMSKPELQQICRDKGLRGFSRLRKLELLHLLINLEKSLAKPIIQKHVLRYLHLKKVKSAVNTEDLFTGEDIDVKDPYLFVTDTIDEKCFVFRARSLLKNFLIAAKFENPYDRRQLNDKELNRLQKTYFKEMLEQNLEPLTYSDASGREKIASPSLMFNICHLKKTLIYFIFISCN